MKLRTRLTFVAGTVISLLAVGISYTALLSAERSEISRLDAVLSLIHARSAASEDPVSKALLSADQSNLNVTIGFITDGDVTILNESSIMLSPPPSNEVMRSGLTDEVTVIADTNFRMRTIELGDQEYLVLAISLENVERNRAENLQVFFLMTLVGTGLAIGGVNFLIRRDLRIISRLVDVAEDISEGDTKIAIPTGRGNAEVDQLSKALARMIRSLQHAVETEQRTQKEMQSFMSDASHELRTPLTVIKGYVELLDTSQELEPAQRQRAFSRIQSEIRRMEALVSDLLLLARLGGEVPVDKTAIDISEILADAVDDLRVLNPDRSIDFTSAAHQILEADELLMRQLLSNALGNIHRHTEADVPVRISLEHVPGRIVIVVEDGGPGLDPEAYRRGIQHFQRFDPSRSRESGGSGLGMSIMNAIVERHQGRISLSKSSLGGLAIRIELPV